MWARDWTVPPALTGIEPLSHHGSPQWLLRQWTSGNKGQRSLRNGKQIQWVPYLTALIKIPADGTGQENPKQPMESLNWEEDTGSSGREKVARVCRAKYLRGDRENSGDCTGSPWVLSTGLVNTGRWENYSRLGKEPPKGIRGSGTQSSHSACSH